MVSPYMKLGRDSRISYASVHITASSTGS